MLYFRTAAEFRAWLESNHAAFPALLVGFHKRQSGRPSMTWSEAVDEALCFGWIDGVRKRVDEESYTIRFARRKKGSIWSAINIEKVRVLTQAGRMHPTGHAAFRARTEDRSRIYSYEQRRRPMGKPYATQFRGHPEAWAFFQAQPLSYRHTATWWVISAKQEKTRQRRLARLIATSAAGRRI